MLVVRRGIGGIKEEIVMEGRDEEEEEEKHDK